MGIGLVTRADDAGLHPVSDRAIRDTAVKGIVRNISLMAPAPAVANTFEVLGDLEDRVDFGLHVTLTAEWRNLRWRPLTAPAAHGDMARTFTRPDGTMHCSVDELVATAPIPSLLMAEVEAQYNKLTSLGFEISYIDTHMGVDSVPDLADALADFARRHNLVNNRALLADGTLQRLPDWPGPAEHPGTELADHLASIEPGSYLLVGHPATKSEAIDEFYTADGARGDVTLRRNRERRMFMDIEIVDYCEAAGVRLFRYSELAGSQRP